MRKCMTLISLAVMGLSVSSAVAGFTPGNVVTVRVGDGTGTVPFDSNRFAQPIFLDEYNATTGLLVASLAIPSTGPLAMTLTARNDDHDGHINLSDDGKYLTLGGYRALPGAAYPVSATSTAVPRVAAVVSGDWGVDTSTALTDAYGGATINAVMTDGTHLWTAGNSGAAAAPLSGGLRYVPSIGSSTSINISQTQAVGGALAPDGLRNARINNGQIYINTASQGSFTNRGVFTTSVALPTPATNTPITVNPVITNHEGSTTDDNGNADPDGKGKLHPKSDAVFADLNGDHTFDVAYSTGGKEELEKWSFNGTKWTRSDVVYLPSNEEINALSLMRVGGALDVYASTDGGIYSFADSGNAGVVVSPTVAAEDPNNGFKRFLTSSYLIPAGASTQFRGLVVIVPEPTTLALAASTLLIARRRRMA